MSIIFKYADISGGNIYVDQERERFELCWFRDARLFVDKARVPVFVDCYFENCEYDKSVREAFHNCIFLSSNPYAKGEWLAQRPKPRKFTPGFEHKAEVKVSPPHFCDVHSFGRRCSICGTTWKGTIE